MELLTQLCCHDQEIRADLLRDKQLCDYVKTLSHLNKRDTAELASVCGLFGSYLSSNSNEFASI